MRNLLPPSGARYRECGIINLDDKDNPGTHWTAYKKYANVAVYMDSFGNLRPPDELIKYLKQNSPCAILYNHEQLQSYNSIICGHLCLKFLYAYNNRSVLV